MLQDEPSPKAKSNMGFGFEIRDPSNPSTSPHYFSLRSSTPSPKILVTSRDFQIIPTCQHIRTVTYSNIFELFSRTHQNFTPLPSLQRQGDCSCAPRHKRKAHHLEKLRYASLCHHSFTAFHISRRCPWKHPWHCSHHRYAMAIIYLSG